MDIFTEILGIFPAYESFLTFLYLFPHYNKIPRTEQLKAKPILLIN